MYFSTLFTLASTLTMTLGSSYALPAKRQIISSAHGSTSSPISGTAIAPGEVFPFVYNEANACESGYTPISVVLVSQPASNETLTSDGEITQDDVLYDFGDYLIANFGKGPLLLPCLFDNAYGWC